MGNEIITKKKFTTALANLQETFTDLVVRTGQEMCVEYDEYQKVCVMNLLGKMKELADNSGLEIAKIDRTNIVNILQTSAMLNLNISAIPSECYLIMRNTKVGNEWQKQFEFNIEGDGNDKLLRKFGVDVSKVHTPWIVRENDGFTYPSFDGLEIKPPTWQPKDYTSKVIRVVYPIVKKDGQVEFHIAEREGVVHNLQAHISNNLMKNKNVSDSEKDKLNALATSKTLDEILNCNELLPYISPAWKSAGGRENMIMRKMKNNATKKYPKDFRNAFAASAYKSTYEDNEQYQHDERINKEEALEAEVEENAVSGKKDDTPVGIIDNKPPKNEQDPKSNKVVSVVSDDDEVPY